MHILCYINKFITIYFLHVLMFVTPSSGRPLCYLLKSQAACFSSSSSDLLNYILLCYNFLNAFFKVFHYTCFNSLGKWYDVLFLIMFVAICLFADVDANMLSTDCDIVQVCGMRNCVVITRNVSVTFGG
jgi:hypothetical protein